jgi:signal transduction histidine kinase
VYVFPSLCKAGCEPSIHQKNPETKGHTDMNRDSRTTKLENRIEELEKLVRTKDEEIAKMKSVFLSKISHEIRTPMNSIIGFSNLLAGDDLTSDQKDLYLEYINSSSENLLSFIENLIDVAMIESDQLEIRDEDCYLSDLFDDLYFYFSREKHKKEKHSVALLMEKPYYDNDLIIRTDSLRLNQILSNLISNALKFTEKGIIVIGYDTSDKNLLKFYVKDTGRGLEMDDQRQIFETFGGTRENSMKYSRGLGLGLQLCKGLVNTMGGEIWVEPNKDRGSVFNFTLPKKISKAKNKSVRLFQQEMSNDLYLSGQDMAI